MNKSWGNQESKTSSEDGKEIIMTIYEKVRCWIIKKLGGYPNAIEAHTIVYDYKSIPIVTVQGRVSIPYEIIRADNSKKDYLIQREISGRIGKEVVDKGLYITQAEHDPIHNCETIGYMVKLADIQKANGMEYPI